MNITDLIALAEHQALCDIDRMIKLQTIVALIGPVPLNLHTNQEN